MKNKSITIKYHADLNAIPFETFKHKDIHESEFGHTGIVVTYELGEWNYRQLILWVDKHIPSFALTGSELKNMDPTEMIGKTRKAARLIQNQSDNKNNGDLGEIILHGLVIDIFHLQPLVSKIYYKTNTRDNIKGFDTVHALHDEELNRIDSLWLGEAKLHKSHNSAIDEAFKSVETLIEAARLREEFMIIKNHTENDDPRKEAIEKLLDELQSLDSIMPLIRIPILIAYESATLKKHEEYSDKFMQSIKAEINQRIRLFSQKIPSSELINLDVHVFFMPLHEQEKILKLFSENIRGLQGV